MALSWSNRMLYGYDGDEAVFKWTYSTFEEFNGERVTPSMYQFMAGYVMGQIPKGTKFREYRAGEIEERAVSAYWNLSPKARDDLRQCEIARIEMDLEWAEDNMHYYIDAVLDDKNPFPFGSDARKDFDTWVRAEKTKWEEKIHDLHLQMEEEELV
jgi:hypothetical protein